MKHLLEVDSVQLEFNNRKILSDVYLKVMTGDIIGLLGRNGQGKTSLFQIIHGVLNCDKSVRVDKINQPQLFRNPEILRFLPQYHFIPTSLSPKRIFSDFNLDFSTFENKFKEFKSKLNSKFITLSGGEKRIIEIYIIVKSKSYFSILDEPFTQLNPLQIEKIKELILEEKENKGFIISDHKYEDVLEVSNTIYVLTSGKIHSVSNINEIESLGYLNLK